MTDVAVLVGKERTVVARVRDDAGIYDVTRGKTSGWSCSCPSPSPCLHVGDVREAMAEAIGL